MIFKFSFAPLIAAIALAQASFASPALERKAASVVFDPLIINPNADTVWVIGQTELVTWDTSTLPSSGYLPGTITLNGVGTLNEFVDLHTGNASIVVPDVTPGSYTITLFGDSGNRSPPFEIVAAQ